MQQYVTKISVKVVKAKSTKLLLRAREGEEKQVRLYMFTQKPIMPLQGRDGNKRKELLSLRKRATDRSFCQR